jgi:tripartite-type tricarboxylate transporter receptor subunit TctC
MPKDDQTSAPGKIDYGSGGPGSPQHLAMAMFASSAGISLTHVPYKGGRLANRQLRQRS